MVEISSQSPISDIKGVGNIQSERLEKLGILTVKDLLFHIPFRYRDTSEVLNISTFKQLTEGSFLGQITDVKNIYTRARKKITKVKVQDATDKVDLTYFNQTYLSKTLIIGEWYIFDGKYSSGKQKGIFNAKFEKYQGDISAQQNLGKIFGIYHETIGINSKWLRKTIDSIQEDIETIITDPLDIKEIVPLEYAIKHIHFPNNREDIDKSRARLAFDEMLKVAIRIEKDNLLKSKHKALPIKEDKTLTQEFYKSLPFELTKDQLNSIKEIIEDISKKNPMVRLLNGDVGSGKTVVSALAILQAVRNKYSSIVLAPTTVLATQHYTTYSKLLEPFGIEVELWISNKKMNSDNPNKVIVGTHAILFKKDLPENLNLVVVDEQHKFGVIQREQLLKKGKYSPHFLSMTATPIPRSLTEIVFGNTQVSTIKSKPKNRIDIKTHFVPYNKRSDCFKWIQKEILKSKRIEQAFVIYPIIEESEVLDAKAVKTEYENLKNNSFKDLKVGLLHGKMKEDEKTKTLEDFKKKKYNILISTSVVEVGIDIPDATIMVIEDAQRFGLAQLHQLRGRVGRSDKQSYCFVIAGEKDEEKEKSIERLKYFSIHNSGFDVAEYDLQTRGPGEVYGKRQSGIPIFKVAQISDIELLKYTREIAKDLVLKDNKQLEYILENLFR